MFKYNLICRVRTGDLLPHVREVEDFANKSLEDFNTSDRIIIQSECPLFVITSEVEITEQQKNDFMAEANLALKGKTPRMECIAIERANNE